MEAVNVFDMAASQQQLQIPIPKVVFFLVGFSLFFLFFLNHYYFIIIKKGATV